MRLRLRHALNCGHCCHRRHQRLHRRVPLLVRLRRRRLPVQRLVTHQPLLLWRLPVMQHQQLLKPLATRPWVDRAATALAVAAALRQQVRRLQQQQRLPLHPRQLWKQ